MRRQTECNFVVRLTWEVGPGHSHPEHTHVCVQDEAMARTAAAHAAEFAPRGLRVISAEISRDAGRFHPWTPFDWGPSHFLTALEG